MTTALPGSVSDQLLCGWGRAAPTRATVWRPPSRRAVHDHLDDRFPRGVVARGLGRSYGDAAQNAGGHVIDATALSNIDDSELDDGAVTCDSGTSLAALMAHVIPLGWFPIVIPGTRFVTIGGAIAADIHGKYRAGSFADSIEQATLATTRGDVLTIGHDEADRDAFSATIGGMGLTGVITEARLRLHGIETASMTVDTERCFDADDCMARMLDTDDQYRYSVAWIDTMATGRSLGRAVLERANHTALTELGPRQREDPLGYSTPTEVSAPPWFPNTVINRISVKAFNEAWFRKSPKESRGHHRSIVSFFHPLDRVVGWNRVYGRRGFLQYQFVVPYGAEAVVRHALERLSAIQAPCFLAVLKRFENSGPGHLSFPIPGWTLTVDVPTDQRGLAELLDGFDRRVADVGGRVYLAKDSRLDSSMVADMYPRLDEWRASCALLDPRHSMTSDLDRRLRLRRPKEH